ncbi:MAG: hypothetical protein ACKOQP_05410 [Bacteroidota bacterium]
MSKRLILGNTEFMMSLVFALTRSVRRLGVRMVPCLLLVHLGWGWPPPCQAQVHLAGPAS